MRKINMSVRPRLQDRYAAISNSDIECFERKNSIILPREYKEFLAKNNGGDFPSQVVWVSKYNRHQLFSFTHFYALNSDFDYDNLQNQFTNAQKYLHLSKSFLPISDDGLGNPICIALDDADIAPIWIWNHETSKATKITSTFAEFLSGIEYDETWIETDPVFSAAEQGNVDELANFLSSGVPIEKRNERGLTLLMCATESSQANTVQLLLKTGADTNSRTPDGRVPLHLAASRNSVDVVKLLIQHGADLEAKNQDGQTPLMEAIAQSRIRMAAFMIQAGANVNVRDQSGNTPLSFCINSDAQRYIAPLLKEHGFSEQLKN